MCPVIPTPFLKTIFFLLNLCSLFCLRSVYCTFCLSQVSYNLSWSCTPKVAKDDFELLFSPPLLTKHWNYRHKNTCTILCSIREQIHTKKAFYQLSYIPGSTVHLYVCSSSLYCVIDLFCHQHHMSLTSVDR